MDISDIMSKGVTARTFERYLLKSLAALSGSTFKFYILVHFYLINRSVLKIKQKIMILLVSVPVFSA